MGIRKEMETRKSRKARTVPFQKTYDSILSKLIKAREEAGLNQRQVSEDLWFSHPFLLKCETGDRWIDVIELLQLAKLYGKAPSYFLED
jgi:hypothetical protein